MVVAKEPADNRPPAGGWDPDVELNGDDKRNRIMQVIQSIPGLNIQEIAAQLGVTRTSIVYHVRHLIKHGTIATHRQGHHLLHFPPSMDEFDQAALSALRVPSVRLIVETAFFHPDPTRHELEERLYMTSRTVRRAFKRLTSEGLARIVEAGYRKEVKLELHPRLRTLLGRNKHLLGNDIPLLDQPKGLKAWLLMIPHAWRTFLTPW